MLDISYGGAVTAGLISFFSPCVLPMVPFYLAYMGGLSMSELREGGGVAPGARRRLFFSSVFFALGVTTIFVLMGMGATALGRAFGMWIGELRWVAGAILAVFGCHFLGIVRVPFLYREARVKAKADASTVFGAYIVGLAFGFGWTPCVGPALAAVLFMASGMGDIREGGVLLLVYGLAMTLPFVFASLCARPFIGWAARNRGYLAHAEKAMGVMLIVFAILIVTDGVVLIAEAMIDWVPWFATIG